MPEKEPLTILDGHPIEESWISNVVRVGLYGGDFNSIQEAINYCVTQTPTAAQRWTVKVYPGTYAGAIAMAQYVNVVGVDKVSVIIDAEATTGVTMADDSRIANLTINPLATVAASAYGIEIGDADGCVIEDINIFMNRTAGAEAVGIIEETGAAVASIHIRNVYITTDQVTNTNTHAISIRQANKTVYVEESYIQGSDYGLALGVSGGAAVVSTIWSKQNFIAATSAAARAVFNNGGSIYLHEDSINRGCAMIRENAGVIIYTDGSENYHVFEGMSIQDTLNNIPVAGCTVRAHDGTYAITDPITITQSNVVLQGDGRNTFIDGDGLATTEHAIVISGKTNVTIRNLAIQTEDGGGKVCHCIFIEDGCNNCHIEEITIVDSDADGIHIEGTTMYDVSIHDITVEDADGYGIFVDMDAANFFYRGRVTSSLIIGTGSSGIYFGNTGAGSYYCEVNENLVFNAGGQGIQALEMYHSDVSKNICSVSTSDGIIINGNHANLEGNLCYNNGGNGIELATAIECNLTGNTCVDNTSSGIELDGASNDNLLVANHCNGNTLDGLRIGGYRVSITGNFAIENGNHGINLGNPDCLVNSNYCYDNSQAAAGTYHGINLGNDADRCQINDNHCNSPGDSQEDGIHLADGADEAQIIGNYCYNGMGSGIALMANNDDCLIKNNYCSANDDYGIEIAAATCNDNTVENNKLVANVTGQILDSGTLTITPFVWVSDPNPSGNIGTHPAEQLTDGLEVVSRIELPIPPDFQDLVGVEAIVVPGGTGNMRCSVATNWGQLCTESYIASNDSMAAVDIAVVIDIEECIDIAAAFTGIAANDLVGVAFTRHGNHANDTVNANCWLLGLRLRYV